MAHQQLGVDERLDFVQNFAGLLLADETLTGVAWEAQLEDGTIAPEITLTGQGLAATAASVFVEGAVADQLYFLRCAATTSAGRRYVRWLTIEGVRRRRGE